MNFFRNRTLKQLSIILATVFTVVVILQITWLYSRFGRVESVQYQIDFVRSTQLTNQQLASQLLHTPAETLLSPEIISLTKQQDAQLKLIETGGRIPGSEIFLPTLHRLPKITYDNLMNVWGAYKKQILEYNAQPEKNLTEVNAQSIIVSDWLGKLIDDLYDEAAQKRTSITTVIFIIIAFDLTLLIALVIIFNRSVIAPLKRIEDNTMLHSH
ncbi:MAG TPA: hypothetical protein VGK39_00225, partial [Cyclobacteriaceae bacterium]